MRIADPHLIKLTDGEFLTNNDFYDRTPDWTPY